MDEPASASLRPARFLALGDSYTIGEGVDEALRWPVQLAARLRAAEIPSTEPRILATTGWTTDELREAIRTHELAAKYDLVSLLIGVNNQYRGRGVANYGEEFSELLGIAGAFAGGDPRRVVVVSIPDWGVTPFAAAQSADPQRVAAEIDQFNAVNCEIARESGAHWVDITDISREGGRAMLADDRLHPSADQYALWVERILPVARGILAMSR
jgi:lysophospholipase L1-like esterase